MKTSTAAVFGSALVLAFSAAPASAATVDVGGTPQALKNAITAANASPGPDVLRLTRGATYAFENPDNGWYGPTALPPIASDITIEGNGATITKAGMAPPSRFFFVGANPSAPATQNYVTPGAGKLTLRNVTLRGGLAKGGSATAGGGGAGLGGAVFSQGQLVIENSTLHANTAQGGDAGGTVGGNGGGGLGVNSNGSSGGGMAGGPFPANAPTGGGGGPVGGGAGGGAGFRTGENGASGGGSSGSPGGGVATGLGGQSGSAVSAGDGSGAGGNGNGTGSLNGGGGGDFGKGGAGPNSGGGGGVGGGGGSTGGPGASGGGGGFGGGGGWGLVGGGSGGFGGGAGDTGATGPAGQPGFGGGAAASVTPARGGAGAGMGGAVFNMQGTLTVRNSTLAGNTARGGEQGGANTSPDVAKGFGGAVFNLNGNLTTTGATMADNTATPNTTGGEGNAIYNLGYDASTLRTGRVILRSTILGLGTGDDALVSDRSTLIAPGANKGVATATLGERNIVRGASTAGGATHTGSPLTGDPQLGPLGNNGGPTPTMAPAANSPAIDAGSAFGLTSDQRGLGRPSDIPGVANFGDAYDIGAVERQGPARPATGGGGAGATPAFGSRTRVTITLAARRIRSRGPLAVRIANGNSFRVSGRLAGQTTKRYRTRRGGRRRFVKLASSRAFTVEAGKRKTVKLRLPSYLRRLLARRGRLSLTLAARVQDPAGHKRTVRKRVGPRLRRARRR